MRKFFCLIMIVLPAFVMAQTPTRESVTAALDELANGFPQEKIYIQYDKPSYSPGETVWFKAYLMSGPAISAISTNLYLDFSDAEGKVLAHEIVPIVEASAKGDFDIPANYKANKIHIHAYTKWMMNFDSSFLYEKDIHILQKLSSNSSNTSVIANKVSLQFFPEGGDCVSGINGKIAFKAIDYNGKPANVSGHVVNSKGVNVAEIKCIHDGMGFFYLDPQPGEIYTAKWKDDQNKSYETPMPEIKKSGLELEVKIAQGKRGFIIKRSAEVPESFKEVHIAATFNQHLVYLATVSLSATTLIGGSIPVDQLPSGILQITLFDSDWVAVAERITFINNDNYHFDPEVGFSALGTNKRGKNTLVIDMPDSVEANLSVAVTDAGIGIDSSDDIISHFLLTGDLRGPVFKPSYYFSDTSDSLQEQLDLVMLTNGWRKIKWEDVVYGKMPVLKYQNDTSYLALNGKVFGATPQELRQSPVLFMIMDHPKDTTRKSIQTIVDQNGNFLEPGIILFDTTKIYYQFAGNQEMASTTEVTFNNSVLPPPQKVYFNKSYNPYYPDTAAEDRNRYLAEEEARIAKLMEGSTLQAVTVTAKAKSKEEILDAKYASGLFSGGNAKIFDVQDDPASKASMSVLTYLKGRVAGLTITDGNDINGGASASWRGGTPSFYVDEMNADITQLQDLNMSDVAMVKVFDPPFIGSFGGGGSGAIAVYTKRGEAGPSNSRSKGLPYKVVIGYAPEKKFYSPNYATFDLRNEQEDMRSTLYWNPMIITSSENHIIRLPFYNNDITNSFRVIVEGVSRDGKLMHVEKVIE